MIKLGKYVQSDTKMPISILFRLYEKQRNLQMATEVYEAYLENYTEDTVRRLSNESVAFT